MTFAAAIYVAVDAILVVSNVTIVAKPWQSFDNNLAVWVGCTAPYLADKSVFGKC